MKNMTIRTIDKTTAEVTKAFQKNACIFGTDEFKLWREYLTYYPDAKMTTKSIKKNPDQKTRRNMTYENMVAFINTQENKEALLAEYEIIKKRSKIQKSPYQYVLTWFETKFKGFNNLAQLMENVEAERKANEAEADASAED